MNTNANHAPPRTARALLRSALPEDVRDAVEGDLHELYVERHATSGTASAAAWYWLQTFSFAMRFTLDRLARAFRAIARGDATPGTLDLILGARLLAKSPGLTIVGGLGMAVAVALGAGAYAVVNSYFFPQIPLSEGERVVAIGKFDPQRSRQDKQLLHDFLTWRRELRTVVDVGAFREIQRNIITQGDQGEPISIAEMTASGFRLARVQPLMGRVFLEDDERADASPVIVIGHRAWQSRFAGDPSIVGKQLRIGRVVHTVIGVMPPGFSFPVNHSYWIPFRVESPAAVMQGSGPGLDVFGRLAPGATKESAQAEVSVVGKRLAAAGPEQFSQLQSRIIPFTDIFLQAEADNEAPIYAMLRFVIGLLLVVVAMNVAVLVYARTVARTGEIAVRTALGATRGRIVAQLFSEALILSLISAVLGLGLVAIALEMFDRALAGSTGDGAPFWIRSGLSAGTVLYAFALALLAAVIVGVFPALRATGKQLTAAMGSLGGGAKAKLGRTWTVLIIAQVAVAVAVLPAALLNGGQMIGRALQDPGFAEGEYLSTWFSIEQEANAEPDSTALLAAADSIQAIEKLLIARLAASPDVVGASIAGNYFWSGAGAQIEVEGLEQPAKQSSVSTVDTAFFKLFDVKLLAGRAFTSADASLPGVDRPVVVNRSFVTTVMGGGEAVGRRIRYRGSSDDVYPWYMIAGVIEDFPAGTEGAGDTGARMYRLSVPGEFGGKGMLTIRLSGQTPDTYTPTLRALATSIDPMLYLVSTGALEVQYREYTKIGVRIAMVIGLLVGSVLLLSAAGIHALVSFTVNQRRREIGIRAALGAPARRILTSVLARASRQLAIGVGLGLAFAIAIDQSTGGFLLNGTGLLLVPGTAAFMLVIGLLAAAGPALKGLRVQPTEALRAE